MILPRIIACGPHDVKFDLVARIVVPVQLDLRGAQPRGCQVGGGRRGDSVLRLRLIRADRVGLAFLIARRRGKPFGIRGGTLEQSRRQHGQNGFVKHNE